MKVHCFLHFQPMPHLSFIAGSNRLDEIPGKHKKLGIYCTEIFAVIFMTNTWVHSNLFFHCYFNGGYFGFFPPNLLCTEHKRLLGFSPTGSVHLLTPIMENQSSAIAMAWTLNLENEDWMCSIITHNIRFDRIAVPTKWE